MFTNQFIILMCSYSYFYRLECHCGKINCFVVSIYFIYNCTSVNDTIKPTYYNITTVVVIVTVGDVWF